MRLQSAQPKTFTELFEVLKDNCTDVLLHFYPDSIKIRSADHAKTFITYVNLYGNAMESYACDKYQPVGINMARMWTVLKFAAADDLLTMECHEDKGEMDIKIMDATTNHVKFETNYITYDCDEEAMEFPENINFGSCISMSSKRFYADLKQLESLEAKYVKLRQCKSPSGGNRLKLIGIGSSYHKEPSIDIDEMDASSSKVPPAVAAGIAAAQVGKDDKEEKRDDNDRPLKRVKDESGAPAAVAAAAVAASGTKQLKEFEMTFPLKKLVQFAKAHCLDSKVGIHLDEKGFLILQYKIRVYGELRFVVAATREDDDDDDDDDEEDEDDSDSPEGGAPIGADDEI